MARRRLSYGLSLLILLVAVGARGQSEYWVSVGSYQNLMNAEVAQRDASAVLAESFAITEADTPRGFFYRVVAGPYLTQEIADHMRAEAQRAGFSSAWILVMDSAFSTLPSFPTDYSTSGEADLDLPEYQPGEPLELPTFELEDRPERSSEHRVIDVAPDDYHLHRLKRDQSAIDWSSPFLLATTEGAVIAAALAAQEEVVFTEDLILAVDINDQEPMVLQQWAHDEASIVVDGRLEEPAWRKAMAVRRLRVTEPDTLEAPTYDTEVRLFYTERGVYVSFDMEQPHDTLVKRLSARDNREVNRDYVSFTLDTSGAARYAYWMTLALGDTQMDGTALPERQFSSNWDGAWWGATRETERGWAAEFFVPWSQMSMPRPDPDGTRRIGFYSARVVAHLNERWAWPPLPRTQPKFMSAFRSLELRDVNPRQQWSVFPYASSTGDLVAEEVDWRAGLDVFWRPATNTQLTATLNPDFGTVEADEVIVNLTALETFFPEKRLFFLEGREVFETTPRSRSAFDPIMLLNTRRIGGAPRLSAADGDADLAPEAEGQPADLYGAGKVTGQAGSFRYGVLTAFEQDTDLETADGEDVAAPGRNFAVGRVLYEDSRQGAYRALGGMATFTSHPDEDAVTGGVDIHLLTQGGIWKVDGQVLYSDLELSGSGGGGFVDVEYSPRQGMKYLLEGTYLDRHVDLNDVGFIQRNDKIGGRVGAEWTRSGFTSIRDLKLETFARYEENLDGYAIRSGLGGEGEITLNNLHGVTFGLKYFPARYDDRNSFGNGVFRIEDRPSIEVGYNTDRAKPLSAFVSSEWEGDGIDGQKLEGKIGFNWRPVDRLNFELSTSYQVRDGWLLHQGGRNMTAFDAEEWQPQLDMDFFLSARQELRMRLQWVGIKAFEDRFYRIPDTPGDLIKIDKPNEEPDDFTVSALNFQVRYRWQIAPLSDLFLVYTRNGFDDTVPARFTELFENAWNDPLGEQLVFKLRYRLGS